MEMRAAREDKGWWGVVLNSKDNCWSDYAVRAIPAAPVNP